MEQSVWASLWAVAAAVVQVVALNLAVVVRINNSRFWYSYQSTIDSFVRLFVSTSTIHFLASWWQMSTIINFVNSWHAYTVQYECITGTPISTSKPSMAAWTLVLSVFVVPPLVLFDQIYLQPQFEPWFLLPLILTRFYSLLLIVFWITNCVFIIDIARNLKKCFFRMLSSSPHPDVVNSYRLLWLGLRHRVADLGGSFSGVLMLLLLTYAVSFVFRTHNLLSVLVGGKQERMKEFLVPWLWSCISIATLCFSSHQVCLECGKYISMEILATKLQSFQPNIAKQIDKFLDAMERNPCDLVLAGCVSLHRPLLLRIDKFLDAMERNPCDVVLAGCVTLHRPLLLRIDKFVDAMERNPCDVVLAGCVTLHRPLLLRIDKFLDAMERNPCDVVLAGCVTLHRPLLLRVVSATVLYLVIFLQFNSKNSEETVQ